VAPEVIALYQRGVQAYDRRTPTGVVEAVATLNDVIRRDSLFAAAWNALAKAYVRAYQRGFQVPDVPHDRLLQLAVTAVDRSLFIDSMSADAWTTHGALGQQIDPTDVAPSLRSIRRAIALDSTQAPAWHFYAIMTAESGDLAGALDAWRRSVRLSPAYAQGLAFLALAHYWQGNFDSAAVWADSAIRVDPNYILARQSAALIAIERGHFDQANANAEAAVKLSAEVEYVNSTANLALVKARSGQHALARAYRLTAEVVSGPFKPTPPHTVLYLAEVYAALGEIDGAIRTLGMYQTSRDLHFQLHLRCSPTFAPMEGDSRFRALLVYPRPGPGKTC